MDSGGTAGGGSATELTRVALLSFVPDSGHLIPLLRLGALLTQAGVSVTLIAPEECAALAARASVCARLFGPVKPADAARTLARISRSTERSRRVYLNSWFERRYNQPIQAAGFRQLAAVRDLVADTAPQLLIADDHLMGPACEWIANECGVPLVLNYSAGTNYRFLARKPWLHRGRVEEQLLTYTGRLVRKLFRWQERVFTPELWRERRDCQHYLNEQWHWVETELARPIIERIPVQYMACGTIALEDRYLADRFAVRRHMTALPTVPPAVNDVVGDELGAWLAADERPVVYVCFGTMAPHALGASASILRACHALGSRVLWAGPMPPKSLGNYRNADVNWMEWAPQIALLRHPRVKGFISHGGAGSVQEAIWAAKPILCVPLTWDQPYNAWVVEQLGIGLSLDKNRLTEQSLVTALGRILNDQQLNQRMAKLSGEMSQEADRGPVLSFLRDVAGSYWSCHDGAKLNPGFSLGRSSDSPSTARQSDGWHRP